MFTHMADDTAEDLMLDAFVLEGNARIARLAGDREAAARLEQQATNSRARATRLAIHGPYRAPSGEFRDAFTSPREA